MKRLSKAVALRRLRAAIDPDLDFVVRSVRSVHASSASHLDATVTACEHSGRRAVCFPLRVSLRGKRITIG